MRSFVRASFFSTIQTHNADDSDTEADQTPAQESTKVELFAVQAKLVQRLVLRFPRGAIAPGTQAEPDGLINPLQLLMVRVAICFLETAAASRSDALM